MKCRVVRFWAGCRMEESRPLPPSLKRHLDRCQDCEAWMRAQRELVLRLRRSAPQDVIPEPPPFLRAKILRAIHEPSRPHTRRRQAWALSLPQAGGALAAGVAALLLALQFQDQREDQPTRLNPVAAGDSKNVLVSPARETPLAAAPKPDGRLLWQNATRLEQPLEREMTLLKEDALTAFHALRTGFVPEELIEEWRKFRG